MILFHDCWSGLDHFELWECSCPANNHQLTMALITYLRYLYMSRQNRVCVPILSMLTFDFVLSIPQGYKKISFVEMRGGGGDAWYPYVAHRLIGLP